MKFNRTGSEIIRLCIKQWGAQFILNEIYNLRKDFVNAAKSKKRKIQLKDVDSNWSNMLKNERINKGKRFKEYIKRGWIKGVIMIKNERNQPIEYFIL